ncbi:unnamed protein product [Rotaria sordida]|uniref:Uncharacterized protein n=1 Tax=Rotaria sordida TaxID=392033 RepID=A0A813ZMU3_9BILA|nr:unnamed protein product [Rotaria sordida]CAF1224735.1 unnamed protein product [Rotaria sordida]CAF1225111.1 unnamed protein product [Rotaria sordida]
MKPFDVMLLIVCSFLIIYCDGSANVHVSDSFIVDDAGRIRIYHGHNFVTKGFPWYPSELLDPINVANLSQWGINFVRLGMMWSGVEPEPQKYNITYLNIMKQIVELLESNQIFVLFDMHQDLLSSRTGSYDGIPAWLYDRFPPPDHPYPWPLKSTTGASWFDLYLTEACSHGFQCLYDNTAGAVESMGNFWRLVATTYKEYSNVLGYEIINEPWAGNYIANPTLLLPGIAGAKNLQPFYEKIAKSIRSVDNDTLIFYEPVTWGVRLNGKYFGSGFTHVPGGDDYRNRSVLSYHYYCIILSLIPVPDNSTIPFFDRVLCDDIEGPAVFRSIEIDLAQLGGSAFLTEFGGCEDSPTCDEQLDWGLDAADEFLQSWAFWGGLLGDVPAIKRLSRVYARAIAGKPLAMQYIASQRVFYLSYYIDPTIKQPTEIYISPIQYPQQSYNITVNRALKWKIDQTNTNIILVEPNEQFVKSKNQAVIGVVEIQPTI